MTASPRYDQHPAPPLGCCSHKPEACLLICRYPMRPVLTTGGRALGLGFACLEIDGSREILVFVTHVKAQALCIDCIAFGTSFERQLLFLGQSGAARMTFRATEQRVTADPNLTYARNGFFANTTRVSAVVVQKTRVGKNVEVTREVFPTNNAKASLLTLPDL